jgi:hypothetical protein
MYSLQIDPAQKLDVRVCGVCSAPRQRACILFYDKTPQEYEFIYDLWAHAPIRLLSWCASSSLCAFSGAHKRREHFTPLYIVISGSWSSTPKGAVCFLTFLMPHSVPTGNFTAGCILFLPKGHTLVTRRLSNVDIDCGAGDNIGSVAKFHYKRAQFRI